MFMNIQMSILKSNIDELIKFHKKARNGKVDKNLLMPIILNMIIQYCGINQNKYHILSSYVIRGIKEIGDLDINMEGNEWKKLKKAGLGKAELYNNQMRYFFVFPSISNDAEMEIFSKKITDGFPNTSFSHQKLERKFLRDDNGHLYYNLDIFVDWKKEVHREKDLQHLILVLQKIKQFKKSNKGKEILKTMGLNTDSQINRIQTKIEKIIDKW